MVEKDTGSLMTARKKILILGATGLLGSQVFRYLSQGPYDVKGASHQDLDITRGQQVSIWMERLHPDVVINCAALSNVDYCEKHPDEAFKVNAEGVKNICLPLIEDVRAKFIHVSTDYVFDGRKEIPYQESDPINPLSIYAKSKVEGEGLMQRLLGGEGIILRVQWLYGLHGSNFSSQLIQEIIGRNPGHYDLLQDRFGNPTDVFEISKVIEKLIQKDGVKGIYHYASGGTPNWVDFGKEIFKLAGRKDFQDHVTIVKEEELRRLAPRPRFTALSTEKIKKELGIEILPWQKQLASCVYETKEKNSKNFF